MVFSPTILKEHSTDNSSNKDKEEEKHLPVVPSTGDTLPSPGKARRKFLRERELAAFAHLYNNRWTEDQIKRELKISKSTYYRYLRALSADQKELLAKCGEDVLWADIGKARFTFRDTEIQMAEILHDKERYTAMERIEAANMLCELSIADLKLLTEGPITTLKEMPMFIRKQLVKSEARFDPTEQVFNIQIGPSEEEESSSSSNNKDGLEKKKKTKKEDERK